MRARAIEVLLAGLMLLLPAGCQERVRDDVDLSLVWTRKWINEVQLQGKKKELAKREQILGRIRELLKKQCPTFTIGGTVFSREAVIQDGLKYLKLCRELNREIQKDERIISQLDSQLQVKLSERRREKQASEKELVEGIDSYFSEN